MTSTASDTPKVSAGFDINAEFRSVMHDLGLSPEDTGGTITFVGEDPIFPSVHRLGACISIPIMAGAAGIADIWRQRTGRGQDLTLDLRKAIHGINPMYKSMPTINGYPYQLPYGIDPSYQIANPMVFDFYRTRDGRFFLPTGAYPRMFSSMANFLKCAPNKESLAEAVSKWDSEELDEAAAAAGVVFAIVRTPEEWANHPQGRQLAERPLVEIVKIGDSDPEPFTPAARPLSGLRVLAATHVIAGNVMARTLAEHGAEVLQIAHPEEFEHEGLSQDPYAGFTVGMAEPCSTRRPQQGLRTGRRRRRVRRELSRPQDCGPGDVARGTGRAPPRHHLRLRQGLQPRRAMGQPRRNGHGSTVRHWVHHRRRHPGTAEVPADQGDERLHRRLHRRRGHPGRADPPGQGGRQLPCAGQPGPLRDVVQVAGHLRQRCPGAHRRAAPTPSARHHHRSNPLRRTGPTGPTGAVLRNQALLARPGTGSARVKQACMDNQLRLRGSAG